MPLFPLILSDVSRILRSDLLTQFVPRRLEAPAGGTELALLFVDDLSELRGGHRLPIGAVALAFSLAAQEHPGEPPSRDRAGMRAPLR